MVFENKGYPSFAAIVGGITPEILKIAHFFWNFLIFLKKALEESVDQSMVQRYIFYFYSEPFSNFSFKALEYLATKKYQYLALESYFFG